MTRATLDRTAVVTSVPSDDSVGDPKTAVVAGMPTSAKSTMTHRPAAMNAFEFVIVSTLRAAQLMRGCTARVSVTGKATTTAQREVAAGKVMREPRSAA